MKIFAVFFIVLIFIACNNSPAVKEQQQSILLEGTWKLISGTIIEKNDTTTIDYTKGKSFIKIINKTHFAFQGHDLNKGKDSASFFTCGSGKYELHNTAYTEHLEYCNSREWEGNDFNFTISMHNDTLMQQGIEKIDSIGINRINIERYVRLKD